MLATQPVVDASRPSFMRFEKTCRGSTAGRGERRSSRRMDIVAIGGDRSVAGPAVRFVRDGVGIGGDGVRGRRRRRRRFRPAAGGLGVSVPGSMAPRIILPSGQSVLALRWEDRSFGPACERLASSISIQNGLRSGSTMLARSLRAANARGKSRYRARCRAEMPLEWVAIRLAAAQNQTVSQLADGVQDRPGRHRGPAGGIEGVCFSAAPHPFSWPGTDEAVRPALSRRRRTSGKARR